MAITFSENLASKVLEARVTDRLTHADYQQFAARFEAMLKLHGKLNVLFEMVNLHGLDAAVVWDDIKFDVKHFSDIERLVLVGDRAWEKAMSAISQFFTTAKLRYFDTAALGEARAWVASP